MHHEPTSTPSALTRRAAFGLGGAGALALLLAGCDSGARLASGTVWMSGPGGGPLHTDRLAPQEGHLIELPGVQYRLLGVSLAGALPAGQLREAGLEVPEDEQLEEVLPASGEQFLVVDLARRPPSRLPYEALPGTYVERVLLDDVEIARTPHSAPEVEGTKTLQLLLSVPEDITPERIVLESSVDGITQRLSLLDGSRISSDIEHVYAPRPGLRVEANWWQRVVEQPWGLLAGFVIEGSVAAVTPDGIWAAADSLMISLFVSSYPHAQSESSTVSLLLPDGSAAAARGDHSQVFGPAEGGGAAWFEVPADIESATARVELGTDGNVVGVEEIAVSFPRP